MPTINININIDAKSSSSILLLVLRFVFNIIVCFIQKFLQKIYDKRIFDGVHKLLRQRHPKKNNRIWRYRDWELQRKLNANNRQFSLLTGSYDRLK